MNKNPTPTRVLVTGARLPAALEIVRALHREGAVAFAGDSLRLTTAGFSRCSEGRVFFPSPAFHLDAFRDSILRAVDRLRIGLVVPVSEEIFFLAPLRQELEQRGARLFAPPLELLRRLHSKWEVREAAEGCGFYLPTTIRAGSAADLAGAVARIPNGVVKPEFSRGAYEVAFLPFPGALPVCEPENPLLVQERVRGREITAYGVASEGALLAFSCYEPLYRVGAGASLFFRPVKSEAAEAAMRAFARKHAFTGQVSFDLIERADGEPALLECNPRATSGVHLCGGALGAALLGRACSAKIPVTDTAAKLAVAMLHGGRAARARRLGALWRDLHQAQDSCFRAADPLPALGLQLASCEIFARSLFWRVPAARAFTRDLEWNGESP
ncbi:MAG: ATP-grasp domain-containing protein [Bdellovibrionota bacterium]